VAAAAYRACVKLIDQTTGLIHDYTRKKGHVETLLIGADDISELWNKAEAAENRKNSTVARELMLPLPDEWTNDERRECVRDIAQHLRDTYGVAVGASIHGPGRHDRNNHVHMMFTTRTVDAEGNFGKKTRILDDAKTGEVKKMRERVCAIVNEHALANGSDWYVYAGKFADFLEDHIPTKHISISSGKNQRQYIEANRAEVGDAMAAIAKTKNRIAAIDAEIAHLQAPPVVEESSHSTPPSFDESYWDNFTHAPTQKRLERIAMPCGAELAQEQLERAHFKMRNQQLELDNWKKEKTRLTKNAPTPEYNFFGRPNKRYKVALAEHAEKMQTAQAAIAQWVEKVNKLDAYIANPERNRLATAYHETRTHNALVDAEEKQMAKENTRAHYAEPETDWSASMQESWREMDAKQKAKAAYSYDNSGYGM
jgi:hypothetical protein